MCQENFKGLSWKIKRFSEGALSVFQGSYTSEEVFQGSFKDIPKKFKDSFKNVSKVFQENGIKKFIYIEFFMFLIFLDI